MGSFQYSLCFIRKSILSVLFICSAMSLTLAQQQPSGGEITSGTVELMTGNDSLIVTSSVPCIKYQNFNKGYIESPLQLIQGKVAGLSISKPGGDPNGLYQIRLRGLSTVAGNPGPLVIIDGMTGGSLENVDPNDIESIRILKDGSASAIYGLRGLGGVIIITTKKGKAGSAVIEYNVSVTAETVARNNNAMNANEWRTLSKETGLGTDFGTSTDWFREIEQTAITQVHNISLSGGNDKTNYRTSINYRSGDGILLNTGYSQLNGRINLTQKALNDRFKLELNLSATERESKYGFAEAFRYASIYNPTAPVKSSAPSYAGYDGYFQQVVFDYYNPVSIIELNRNEGKNRLLNMSVKAGYEIVKGLTIDAFYSKQTTGALGGQYYSMKDYWGGMNRNGLASRREDNSSSQLLESTIRYSGNITSALNLNILAGYSYQDFSIEGFSAAGGDFLTDKFTFNNLSAALDFKYGKGTINSYKNLNKLSGYFGCINLDIKSTWFLTASARYDGSSRFASANKWGFFPAIGAGVDLSRVLGISVPDQFKLRVNYGITGNQPNDNYTSMLYQGSMGSFYYNGSYVPFFNAVNNVDAGLKPEKMGEFDAGFDFSLFRARLSGSFDYYTRTTSDLLFLATVPVPPNLYNQALVNLGKLRSSGLELTLNINVIKKADFSYNMTFTPSYIIDNSLVSLSGSFNGVEISYGKQDLGEMGSPGQNQVPLTRVEAGKPVGQILALVFKKIDTNGSIVYADANNNGMIDQADRQVVGNGLPKFLFGIGNEFSYRNWDLNVLVRGVLGHDLINSYRALYEVPNMISSYNLPETASDMRNASTHTFLNSFSGLLSSNDVENASFLCLDNLSLGYSFSLPVNSQFSKIRLYLAGNNLFYITRYKGADPNPRYADSSPDLGTYNNPLVPGVDRMNTWPRTRSVTFGANIVF